MTLSTNRHIFWERPANRHETSWPSLLSCQDVLGRGDQGVEPLAALARRACPAPGSPAPLHGLAPGPGGRQRHPPGVAALRPTAAPSSSAGVGTFSHATSPGAVGGGSRSASRHAARSRRRWCGWHRTPALPSGPGRRHCHRAAGGQPPGA